MRAAESALATILSQPALASAMGREAHKRAFEQFSPASVSAQYRNLFDNLAEIRKTASVSGFSTPPLRLDPVRCFSGYASHNEPFSRQNVFKCGLPNSLLEGRSPFASQIKHAISPLDTFDWDLLCGRKHC